MDIYLDHAASSPLRPEAFKYMTEIFQMTGNAASIHRKGRNLENILETAREEIAQSMNAQSKDIVFTSGGTESNNTIIHSRPWKKIICSCLEHDSILNPAHNIIPSIPVKTIPISGFGHIDLDWLEDCLSFESKTDFNQTGEILVSILAASGDLGSVQPVEEISRICQKYGAWFHCDSAQYFGKTSFDVQRINADSISLSAHKIGGPQGIGALILKPGINSIRPFNQGGGQERNRRSGTSPVALAGGFGKAAKQVSQEVKTGILQHYKKWYLKLYEGLKNISSDILIHGNLNKNSQKQSSAFFSESSIVNNILSFTTPGWSAQEQVIHLDLQGIAISAGSACSSGKNKMPVAYQEILKGQNQTPDWAKDTVRISTGWTNTDDDIEAFLNIWGEIYAKQKLKNQT